MSLNRLLSYFYPKIRSVAGSIVAAIDDCATREGISDYARHKVVSVGQHMFGVHVHLSYDKRSFYANVIAEGGNVLFHYLVGRRVSYLLAQKEATLWYRMGTIPPGDHTTSLPPEST